MRDRLREIFFRHPWRHEAVISRVCEGKDGDIIGFLGATPRQMRFEGRLILAAVSSHLMVDPAHQPSLIGLQLNKLFLSGPQDLSFSDGGNLAGLRVWEGIGGSNMPLHGISWFRPVRPTQHFLSVAAGKYRLSPSWLSLLRPACNVADRMLTRLMPRRFPQAAPTLQEFSISDEALLGAIQRFSKREALHPEYDPDSLGWFLRRAENARQHGALQKIAISRDGKDIAGWFLYYLQPGGHCEVLQIMAERTFVGAAFDHLFDHARRLGATSVGGRIEPKLMEALATRGCYYEIGEPWAFAHAKSPEILQAMYQGRSFLTKLEGEWCTSFRF